MTPPSARRDAQIEPTVDPWADVGLAELGLVVGDVVRFRRHDGERWRSGRVERRERDGSIGLRDDKGAARALAPSHVEARRSGPRGGLVWVPVDDLAATAEQRRLL